MNDDSIMMQKVLNLLEQMQNNLAIAGGRGGGPGTVSVINKGRRVYGRSDYSDHDLEHDHEDEQEEGEIKVSRAFLKDDLDA